MILVDDESKELDSEEVEAAKRHFFERVCDRRKGVDGLGTRAWVWTARWGLNLIKTTEALRARVVELEAKLKIEEGDR